MRCGGCVGSAAVSVHAGQSPALARDEAGPRRGFGATVVLDGADPDRVMLLGPAVPAVLGVALVAPDVLMMRWIVATFDREKVVSSFL